MKRSGITGFLIILFAAVLWTVPVMAEEDLAVSVTGMSDIEPGVSSTLTANVTGGYEPYTYLWSDGEESRSIMVSPDNDTSYNVTVTDVSGNSVSAAYKVKVKNGLSVTIDGSGVVGEGKSVILKAEASDGLAPYTYSWDTTPTESGSSIEVSPASATSYTVTVTDMLGASASAHILIKVSPDGKPVADADYSISLNEAQIDFGTSKEDGSYDPTELAQTVTVKNAGDSDVTLKTPGSAYYKFSGMAGGLVLKAGDSVEIAVAPKEELDPGEYDETIVFRTEQDTKAVLDAHFTVAAPAVSADSMPSFENESIMETKDYTFGRGRITLEIDNKSDSIGVGIRQTSDFADALLSEEEKQAVAEGGSVTLKLTSELYEGNDIPQDDRELIESAVEKFHTDIPLLESGAYIGLELAKKTDDGEWYVINSLAKDVALQFELPYDLVQKGRQFRLLRADSPLCRQVAVWDDTDTEYTFNTSKFGVFNVAYIPAGASVSQNLAKTGRAGLNKKGLFIAAAAFAAVVLIIYFRSRRHGRRTGRDISD